MAKQTGKIVAISGGVLLVLAILAGFYFGVLQSILGGGDVSVYRRALGTANDDATPQSLPIQKIWMDNDVTLQSSYYGTITTKSSDSQYSYRSGGDGFQFFNAYSINGEIKLDSAMTKVFSSGTFNGNNFNKAEITFKNNGTIKVVYTVQEEGLANNEYKVPESQILIEINEDDKVNLISGDNQLPVSGEYKSNITAGDKVRVTLRNSINSGGLDHGVAKGQATITFEKEILVIAPSPVYEQPSNQSVEEPQEEEQQVDTQPRSSNTLLFILLGSLFLLIVAIIIGLILVGRK